MIQPGSCVLRKHSLSLRGHATSVSLEDPFWEAFQRLARSQGRSTAALAADLDQARTHMDPMPNLSSMIRIYVLTAAQNQGVPLCP